MIVYTITDLGEDGPLYRPAFRHTLEGARIVVATEPGPFRAGFEVRKYQVVVTSEQLMHALAGDVNRAYIEANWSEPERRWRGTAGGGLRELEHEAG